MGPQISHLSILNSPANVIDNGYAIMVTWARIPKSAVPTALKHFGNTGPSHQFNNISTTGGLLV